MKIGLMAFVVAIGIFPLSSRADVSKWTCTPTERSFIDRIDLEVESTQSQDRLAVSIYATQIIHGTGTPAKYSDVQYANEARTEIQFGDTAFYHQFSFRGSTALLDGKGQDVPLLWNAVATSAQVNFSCNTRN